MLLSDSSIRALLESGDVSITPKPELERMQPISVDLLFGDTWAKQIQGDDQMFRWYSQEVIIQPGEFMLGCTRERIVLPRYVAAFVHGKSTLARQGLMVEAAGLVDPGFEGTLTLELKNIGHRPLRLPAGSAACQITLHMTDMAVVRPYGTPGLNSHYQGQEHAEPAR